MLIISGLLTLLVISHAGCAGIKGGLRTKGGTLTQEQVAQEDIPAPYSIKTGSEFGTKVTTGDADGRIKNVMSKKAPAPALHHTVKTAVDRTSKTHPVPGLHHAATSPVVQDQVLIEDSAVDTSGIKTIKTAASEKTRFSHSDSQVRQPVARPVVQTIKTVQGPATYSSQGVKTLKTIDTGKTRFSEQDKQQRDPTARPIIQTLQSTVDSTSDSTKTLKAVTRGKTRFSQGDTQVRDPTARPVIQNVKTDKDSFAVQQTVKTSIKTEPSDIRRKTIKSSQKNVESASASSVPESIVETARRNTLRISVPDSQVAGNQGISTSGQILRSQGETGIRQTTTATNAEKIIFNGKEINIGGLTTGQIFDENLQPILTSNVDISGRTDIRTSSTPITTSGVPQTAAVSSYTSNAGTLTRTTIGTTRRRQQAITIPRETVALRTPERRPISSRVQTGTSMAGLRSQGGSGVRHSTTTGSQETVLFNGKEISIGGLQAGQLFDENLQPILSDMASISGQANMRASTVPQIPQPVRSTGVTQTAGVSSFTSSTGSLRGTTSETTRRRQQVVTIPRERGQPRTPARQPISSVVQTGTSTGGLRSQGAAGIRQSTTTGSQETVLFNGKEISVGGLQAGQLFDENLQPILSDRGAISGQENLRASPVPQIRQPVRSAGITQTSGVSTFTSSTGSITGTTSGATRRRQQTLTVPKEKVQIRTPARQPISSVVQTGAFTAGLRSQGTPGIRQSTTTGSQETVLFNGKEISVAGLQSGQLFDENLQPILSDRGAISGQANLRASPLPQIPQPVRSTGVTQTAGVSSFTSSTGSITSTTSGATRRRQQGVTVPKEKVQLRTPARQPISSVVQTGTPTGGFRSQGAAGIRQSTTTGSQETVLFNGKEISVAGLQSGQLFDENLQPILSDRGAISGQANIRASPLPQIPQPVRSAGVTQTSGVSSFTSSTGSITRTTSGATRRRQQGVTVPKQKVQLRAPARQPISSVVQTGTSTGGLRSQGAAGIRQSTTTGSQETVLFNGKEISVTGLQSGQLFDENLQPILSDRGAISGQANLRASPLPQISQPVRSTGVTQTAGDSSFTSSTGSITGTTSGATRRRQQGVTVPKEKVQLRTPARQPISSVVQTDTPTGGFRSQGAAGIRQSTTTGSQETVLFNGKEISVAGLQSGQLFDENLQPILSDRGAISGQANLRASPVPQIPQTVRSAGVTQTSGVSSFTSSTGSITRTTSGATRRRQQGVTVPKQKVQLRAPARQPISSVVQTGISTGGLRTQGAAGIRQSTTTGSQETVLFNGKEISVAGLQSGQLFDENLQPILSDRGAISGQANLRASPLPQIPQPVRSTGVTQTAGVSSFTSSTGSITGTTSGATRRRQQGLTVPKEKVQLRTPARQPISSVVQTGTPTGGFRSQGAAGIRQSTTTGSQETVLFNGKEISVAGLQSGQLFDENLQPILSDRGAISGQANLRASPLPQIPQPVRSTGVTQTAGVSSFTSSTGSITGTTSGATRRRQQGVTVPKQKVQLRAPARQRISSVVQTGTSTGGLRTQGAAGIRQSTTTGSQETVLFNGKEISVAGLQSGQLFDENLQPILSDRGAISGQANLRASPVPQIPQPVRSAGVTQTSGVSSFTSSSGSITRTTGGATRRRQQGVTVPKQKVQLRAPARQPISSVVQTGTSTGGLRSQGAAGIRQSTTTGSQETVLFNGKEISVAGLQSGQLFDENLQPILSDRGAISGQANLRASPLPQIPQPVRSTGVTQTAGVSSFTSSTGSITGTTSGATRRRQQGVTVPKQKVQLRAPARQPISSVVQTGTSTGGLRSQGAAGIRQSTTTGSQETVLFNGKEISVTGLQSGQLFDENLQPILSDRGAISGQANLRVSPLPQIPQPVRSTGVTQTAGVSSFTSSTGSITGTTSGATRRRQQGVTVPKEKVQLRTPARQPISSVVQTGTPTGGFRSQGAAGIRQSTTTGSQETVLFNGKEISVAGLQSGQLFDENLQPILSDRGAISGQANLRASPLPQIPQPVRSTGVTQTAGVSSFTSSTGSITGTASGATRRRQQGVTVPKQKVQLRTPARQPISSVVQTGTSTGGLRSQSAAGIRQSTATGSQETVLFNGKEISVAGLQSGQLFDENLQPILSNRGAISGQAILRASPVPQIPQPVRSTGVTQTAGVSSLTSSTGSLTRTTSGATRRIQQAITVRKEKVQLRTPARQPVSSVIPTGTSAAGFRSQGASGIRQSTTSGSQGTVLFNGKEISVAGLQAGQLFDENLQPIRSSAIPQNVQPVISSGVRQTSTNLRSGVESSTIVDRSGSRGSEFGLTGSDRKPTDTSGVAQGGSLSRGSGLRTSGLPRRQSSSRPVSSGNRGQMSSVSSVSNPGRISNTETILFNGKEVSIGGLSEGQLFDENLQPISPYRKADDISITGRTGSAQRTPASGLRTGVEPQRSSSASARISGGLREESRSYSGSSRSSGSQSSIPFTSSRRLGLADQNLNSRGAEKAGILQLNAGAIAYTSDSGSRGSNIQRKISQDRITQEISQDRVEIPVIQEKQNIPVVPQLKVEDIVEQTSVTNPAALKTAQIQETVPFTIPRTPSKPSFTKMSQVSQKNIDSPTIQQQVVAGDFSGYLPKTSFLPPFNYGVPVVSASKYSVKSPIIQEQQKVEQEFV